VLRSLPIGMPVPTMIAHKKAAESIRRLLF
jgi:hypothetical protein